VAGGVLELAIPACERHNRLSDAARDNLSHNRPPEDETAAESEPDRAGEMARWRIKGRNDRVARSGEIGPYADSLRN